MPDPVPTLDMLVGPAAMAANADDYVLPLGPHHPTAHGGLRVRLWLDPDSPSTTDRARILRAEPEVGFLHRGVEKLFESRDYRQIVMLADRHDWLSAFGSELGVVLAVEQMLGIEVPPRAVWLRTLLAEWTRITHHLAFLGRYPDAGAPGLTAARESMVRGVEAVTGGRVHPMFNRVGGVKEDLPDGWATLARGDLATTRRAVASAAEAMLEVQEQTRGVGILKPAQAAAYGASGVVARACGLAVDARLDEPYLAYPDVTAAGVMRAPTREAGDAAARLALLIEEVDISLEIVEHSLGVLDELGEGPVSVRLPKVVRPPEGATYVPTENPAGLHGYYLVSHGEKTPWRLKIRTPGFNHAALLGDLLTGARVKDLVPILASVCLSIGDIDR